MVLFSLRLKFVRSSRVNPVESNLEMSVVVDQIFAGHILVGFSGRQP